MLDKRELREHAAEIKAKLLKRGTALAELVDEFVAADVVRRKLQGELDQLKQAGNQASKKIGELMKTGQREAAEAAKTLVREGKEKMAALEAEFKRLDANERDLLLAMPNLTHDSVPEGGEECAQQIKEWGTPRTCEFELKDHVALCDDLQLVNFEAGARLAGSGFPVMHGQGAILQRALINLMLDTHIARHGYTELRTPFMVHPRCPEGTGQLPKFGSEMYRVSVEGQDPPEDVPEGQPHFYLIPTSEVTICNYYREQILEAPELPIKLTAYSPCWRVEGGSYGKEARGLMRLHQFDKVELVRITNPETSWTELEELTSEAEHILELLELPYRRIVLPTGDMAFGSAKTYDVEVHCPADDAWREISSASNTTDYQARRMNLRFRREKGAKPEYPHILNASGLALPRLIIAVLENYQQADGSVSIPKALLPYMAGRDRLTPPEHAAPVQ